jgi:hypothetical protein
MAFEEHDPCRATPVRLSALFAHYYENSRGRAPRNKSVALGPAKTRGDYFFALFPCSLSINFFWIFRAIW